MDTKGADNKACDKIVNKKQINNKHQLKKKTGSRLHSNYIRSVTKLFRSTKLKIKFCTTNTIKDLLQIYRHLMNM
jgi:hypothetical protein